MYCCGNCGAAVSADAKSCPNCRAAFGGKRQGSEAERVERQQRYKQTVKADRLREKRRERERRADRRAIGSQKRWNRIAHRNAESCGTSRRASSGPSAIRCSASRSSTITSRKPRRSSTASCSHGRLIWPREETRG